jgi:hypothetical protein
MGRRGAICVYTWCALPYLMLRGYLEGEMSLSAVEGLFWRIPASNAVYENVLRSKTSKPGGAWVTVVDNRRQS